VLVPRAAASAGPEAGPEDTPRAAGPDRLLARIVDGLPGGTDAAAAPDAQVSRSPSLCQSPGASKAPTAGALFEAKPC